VTSNTVNISGRLEPALFAAFMAILVWAPLPFASNRIWGGALLVVLVGLVFCAWLTLFLFRRVEINPEVWRYARLPLALLLLVQLWVFVQTLPLPRAVVELLSPQAYAWHIDEGWLSLSLDREYTAYYLLRGCAYTAGFFLALVLVNSQRRVSILLQVLVFSGTFQAAYGAFMVLSGLELGFFVEKYAGQGVATGTFVNRNHLAGYLVMCLSAGIGLLLSQLAADSAHSWKERLRRWLRLLLSSKIRLRIYLAIMVVALVLTRARMGNIAFFTSLGVAGALVDMLILGKWFGFDKLLARLEQTNPATEARVRSSEYAFDYLGDFPLTGSGGGSFYGIFPNYQPADFQAFHLHAHNDYLEFAVELGIPFACVLGVFVALAFWSAYRVQCDRRTPLFKGAAFAVTMTIVWAAIHSTSDFNLQIPANALTFITILALAFISRGLKPRGQV